MALKRHVELVMEQGESTLEVEVDSGQIQQALTNLVVNGIHAMSDGGELRVTVARGFAVRPSEDHGTSVSQACECAQVIVVDHGKGILPEEIGRVFEPFFTTKDIGEGTGLGLSVSHGIVRDHGGWISVSSQIGRGSRFTIHLPLPAAQGVLS